MTKQAMELLTEMLPMIDEVARQCEQCKVDPKLWADFRQRCADLLAAPGYFSARGMVLDLLAIMRKTEAKGLQ